MVRDLKRNDDRYFLWLKWNKIDATDKFTSLIAKSSEKNVFRSKKTTNMLLPKMFRGFEETKKDDSCFERQGTP